MRHAVTWKYGLIAESKWQNTGRVCRLADKPPGLGTSLRRRSRWYNDDGWTVGRCYQPACRRSTRQTTRQTLSVFVALNDKNNK